MFVIIKKTGSIAEFIASNTEALPEGDKRRRLELGLGSHGVVLDDGEGNQKIAVLDEGYKWKVF